MPLTTPSNNRIPDGVIPSVLKAERILYEAEAPVLFITRNQQGQLLLAYVADESRAGVFTLLTPVTTRTLKALESGTLSVRDALASAPTTLHWKLKDESSSWALDLDEFPDEYLPVVGTTLFPQQEPVLRTRAVGPEVVLGRMPASVIAFVADATRRAVKTILDHTLEARSDGRPRDEHRSLYDLPVQNFAFASFELSFAAPDERLFSNGELLQAAEKLNAGLAWASSLDEAALNSELNSDREAILRAALLLTPPSNGHVTQVEVSGSWISAGKVSLTRNARRKVREALREIDTDRPFTATGRLSKIDTDKFTFALRDTTRGVDLSGSFAEEMLEDMIDGLTERVFIAGTEGIGGLRITTVVVANERTSDSPPI